MAAVITPCHVATTNQSKQIASMHSPVLAASSGSNSCVQLRVLCGICKLHQAPAHADTNITCFGPCEGLSEHAVLDSGVCRDAEGRVEDARLVAADVGSTGCTA
jgi:hypothetical protein